MSTLKASMASLKSKVLFLVVLTHGNFAKKMDVTGCVLMYIFQVYFSSHGSPLMVVLFLECDGYYSCAEQYSRPAAEAGSSVHWWKEHWQL
jgi:hypothetical protein